MAAGLLTAILSACAGPGAADPPGVIRWGTVIERTNAEELARECSGERMPIVVEALPTDVDQRRQHLIRRLAAGGAGLDLVGLDSFLVAELADADLLAELPDALAATIDDAPRVARDASVHDGEPAAVPWWFDPQFLWYRGSVAERAGLDVNTPISWADLLRSAERIDASVVVDDPDGTGLSTWISGLVAAAGGRIVDDDLTVRLDTPAGRTAARIVRTYVRSGLGDGPVRDAAEQFADSQGGFLLAGPAVLTDEVLVPVADDLEVKGYPRVGRRPVAPVVGAALAVPAGADDAEAAFAAIACLTSAESLTSLATRTGHVPASTTLLGRADFAETYPLASAASAALESGVTLTTTPAWERVRTGLRESWLPLISVTPATTPALSQDVVAELLDGGLR